MKRKRWIIIAVVTVLAAAGIFAATAVGKEAKETGYLGVFIGEVTSDIASDYGVKAGAGVVVEGVSPGSPAEEAGLRENDVIVRVNNATPTGPEEFRKQIASFKPDQKVELVYMRGGKERTVEIKLAKRAEEEFEWGPGKAGHRFRFEGPPWEWHKGVEEPKEKMAYAGIVTQEVSDGLASYFKVDKGALISEVMKNSPAEKAGLKAGDVILKIGAAEIEDEGDVSTAIRDQKPGTAIDFKISRDGNPMTVTVTLGEQLGSHDEPMIFGFGGMTKDMPGISKQDMDKLRKELDNLKIEIEALPNIEIDTESIRVPPVKVRIERHESFDSNGQSHKMQSKSPQRLRDRLTDAYQKLKLEVDRLFERAFA